MRRAFALLLVAIAALAASPAAEANGVVACYPWPNGGAGCVAVEPTSYILVACVGAFQEVAFGLWTGAAVCV